MRRGTSCLRNSGSSDLFHEIAAGFSGNPRRHFARRRARRSTRPWPPLERRPDALAKNERVGVGAMKLPPPARRAPMGASRDATLARPLSPRFVGLRFLLAGRRRRFAADVAARTGTGRRGNSHARGCGAAKERVRRLLKRPLNAMARSRSLALESPDCKPHTTG